MVTTRPRRTVVPVGGCVVEGAVTVVRPSEVLVPIRVVGACGWVVWTGMVTGAAAGGGAPTSFDASSAAPTVSATTASGTSTQTSHRRRRGGAGAPWRVARPGVTVPPYITVGSAPAAG